MEGNGYKSNEKEKVFFCACCGRKLFKNGNGNGLGKEKKKEKVIGQILEKIYPVYDWLKYWKGADIFEILQKVKELINIIEDAFKKIRDIDEEKKEDVPFYSAHHPLKRAVWGSNDYKIVFCSECHTNLEKNITRAEALILRIRPRIYAEVNARFINSGGQELSDKDLVEIIFNEEMRLRKVPKDTLRKKLTSSFTGIVEAMRNMIDERIKGR